jgi:3',5'-cyclic AMP phosphodiesterase CpdA
MSTKSLALLGSIILLFSTISFAHSSQANNFLLSSKPMSASNLKGSIYYPRCSDPIFVTPGGKIGIIFNFSSDNFASITFSLATAYEPITDYYSHKLNMSDWENLSGNEYGINYNLTIPDTLPVELYNLTLTIFDGNYFNVTQPRAVDVISSFKNDFTFIQLSDLHVGSYRGRPGHPLQNINNNDLLQAIKEVNLLHPDFVIISGDLVHGQVYHNEYSHEYPLLYNILQTIDVPTFICPGNHDGYNKPGEDGKTFWTHYFGPDYYSFNYGPYHFQMLDSYDFTKPQRFTLWFAPLHWGGAIGDTQLHWIQTDLAANTQAPLTFMVLHHNPSYNATTDSLIPTPYLNRQPLLNLINDYNVDMVIGGHTHWDNVTTQNGTVFVTTTTTSGKPDAGQHAYQGYRQYTIQNGTITNYNYQDPQNSTPIYKLTLKQLTPTSVTINNQQIHPATITLRFTVPLGTYTPSFGSIIQTRSNATSSELYVQATIPAGSSQLIRLNQR